MKILLGLLIMMVFVYHPSLNVILLLGVTLRSINSMKGNYFNLSIFTILIVFSTGILLLLFYISMINDTFIYLKYFYLMSLIMLLTPNMFNFTLFKMSMMASGLELINSKFYYTIFFGLMMLIMVLLIMNKFFNKMKFLRQVF